MEVILLENVRNLGQLGDKVTVKNGYGRNFLMPYGKAVRATAENSKKFEERRKELEEKAQAKLAAAQQKANQLASLVIDIAARAGDEGKLFGSITQREIALAINDQGIEINKSEILLPEGAIRMIGEYEVSIQLHTDVEGRVKVNIIEAK